MKKFALLLILALSITTLFPTVTSAASALPISVVVNDNKLSFPDVQPFIDANGRTQTPAKFIGEALGATVVWSGKEQKATFTFGNRKLVFYIGKKSYVIDGLTKQMDTTAILKNGRTFIPAKYIADAFGADIKWDGAAKTVYLKRTIATQTEDGQDVADGIVVNNQAEVVEALRLATYTLQAKLVVKCDNYEHSDYSFNDLFNTESNLYGIESMRINTSTINDVADTTFTLTYAQVFKIQQARTNKIALSRLSDEDISVVNKIENIISLVIKDNMTDYDKELAIHDYLVLNFKYDYDNYVKGTLPSEAYTPYGLLINGTGVCQAYADAAKLLLNAINIECEVVTGTADGIAHAWNVVKLDNEYYMLDVTWDDPVPDNPGQVSYSYFNVTADQLSQDHIWESSNWPIANGIKYNYFTYNNLVVNNYSEFKQFVTDKIIKGERKILVYINNYNKTEYDLSFINNYYNGRFFYTVPDTKNSSMTIMLE